LNDFNVEENNTICPACGNNHFWIKYFVNKMIYFCKDCQYSEEIK